jgi:hypothetical protein
MTHVPWPQGLTACLAPELTREGVFDAIAEQRTYATTNSRTYLDANWRRDGDRLVLSLAAASHQGIDEAIIVHNGHSAAALDPSSDDGLALEAQWRSPPLAPDDYLYVRICTTKDEWAWSSPVWGSDG